MRPARTKTHGIRPLGTLTLLTALFFVCLGVSGCSNKDEAPAPAAKAQETKAPAPAAHKMPIKAAHTDPGMTHFNNGLKLALQGKYDKAIEEYKLVLEINPKSAETYNNIGFAYYDKGDLDEAVKNQNKALEINHDLANGYFGLALAYEKKGDKEKALTNWKEYTKRTDPKSKWHKKAQGHIEELTKQKTKPKTKIEKKQVTH